jgi:hypothetical protein
VGASSITLPDRVRPEFNEDDDSKEDRTSPPPDQVPNDRRCEMAKDHVIPSHGIASHVIPSIALPSFSAVVTLPYQASQTRRRERTRSIY